MDIPSFLLYKLNKFTIISSSFWEDLYLVYTKMIKKNYQIYCEMKEYNVLHYTIQSLHFLIMDLDLPIDMATLYPTDRLTSNRYGCLYKISSLSVSSLQCSSIRNHFNSAYVE